MSIGRAKIKHELVSGSSATDAQKGIDRARIKNRLFYRFAVKTVSPLSIASGTNTATDHDILLTQDDRPFITGTSLAGAIRHYLENTVSDQTKINLIFGKTEGEKCRMSRIFISDIIFCGSKVSVRDGIRLDENKVTVQNAKYDYEFIEPDALGFLSLEYVLYDTDPISADDIENVTLKIVSGINHGAIRFGFKKQRGLGVLSVLSEYEYKFFGYQDKKFTPESYIDFLENRQYDNKQLPDLLPENNMHYTFSLHLSQKGGISIRTYTAIPNEPDFSHITANKKPVIPASSWNGAVRHRAFDILQNSLNADENTITELKHIWGECGENQFVLSQIEINESILQSPETNGGFIRMTRNKINRFDNSTVDRALYSENSFFNGNTELHITVKNIEQNQWVAGLLVLVLKDIANGLLAVGGQTAVGRGIFQGDFYSGNPEYVPYLQALYEKLKGGTEK